MSTNENAFLNGFSHQAKTPLIIGAIVIILLAGLAMFWVMQKEYSPLFSDLDHQDAANIVKQLESMKVDYQLEHGGTTITVPASSVHETRLKLMGSGLNLSGGVGYEIFDDADFGMTEFAQKINFQRALEGELQRTIASLKQVRQARVHLVMPDRGLFTANKEVPTASVTLILEKNMSLNENHIVGIQQLVSSSVPQLKPYKVTISDQEGVMLSQAMPQNEAVHTVPWQLKQKIEIEQYLTDKVDAVLGNAFAKNQIAVSIDVVMDFSQIKKKEEQVIPVADGKAILRQKESRIGNGSKKSSKSGQNITKEVEYEMGHSVAEIIESPGRVKKINVGILLPATLSEIERQEIQGLIEVTVGINKARGDSVAVYTKSKAAETVKVAEVAVNPLPVIESAIATQQMEIATDKVEETAEDGLSISKQQAMYIAIGAGLLFLLMLVIIIRQQSKQRQTNRLTADQREQVLLQLQHWLSEAK